MKVNRTDDARFVRLKDWPFQPRYLQIAGGSLRVHYVDEGPPSAPPVLLMHGEPTWSYLCRHIIPPLVAAGRRVLAPDLVGFGRSDKPTLESDYTYERHVAWMTEWLEALGLFDITLFCQDWGGLIGLRLVAAQPGRFSGVVASNTGLPIGSGASEAFLRCLATSQNQETFPVSTFVQTGTKRQLDPDELAAYDAPFPSEAHKAGAKIFPSLVPLSPDLVSAIANRDAWRHLAAFDKPFLTAFSDGDPITTGGDREFQKTVGGALGLPHVTLKGGHFIQEDSPKEGAEQLLRLQAA